MTIHEKPITSWNIGGLPFVQVCKTVKLRGLSNPYVINLFRHKQPDKPVFDFDSVLDRFLWPRLRSCLNITSLSFALGERIRIRDP